MGIQVPVADGIVMRTSIVFGTPVTSEVGAVDVPDFRAATRTEITAG